ncbi:MAG: phage late control D family protein [Pirellulaceae bacterium]|nr:phage late control D family protein [Pirellulaceae bacterium]
MTEPLFGVWAPVFEIEGNVFGELGRDAVRLEVDHATDGLKTLQLRLAAVGSDEGSQEPRLLYLDGRILDFGKSLVVAVGSAGGQRYIFRGRISGLEAHFEESQEHEVAVLAEDRLMDLRMTRRSRTYENVSDAQIAEEIAAEHGLSVEAAADGPSYDVVQQWNMSDLAFLRERARRVRAEVWVERDTLYFQSRSRRAGTELTLVRGNNLLAVELRADLAGQRTAVRVSGYDAGERAGFEEEAGDEAIAAEIRGGRTGPAILAAAFGPRISHRVRDVPLVATEAADWARAEMLRRGRSFVQATGVTEGSPDMIVGSRLRLERVGRPFEGGDYYVTQVRHCFDLNGYRTHFEAERAVVEEAG